MVSVASDVLVSPKGYTPPTLDFDDLVGALRHSTDAELRAAHVVLRTIQSPWLMKAGRALARIGLALRVPGTSLALRRTVFRQFCGGTDLESAVERAGRLYARGIASILDYAVEGEDSEADFDGVTEELLRVVQVTADKPEIAFAAIKLTGLARFGLLEAVHEGRELSPSAQAELSRAVERLKRICEKASASGAAVFVDAEHSWIQGAIDQVVEDAMVAHNRERAVVHTTVQLYLADRLEFLRAAIKKARKGGYQLGVKLVRGAYMEQENERAEDRGYPSPVQPSKEATDAAYNEGLTLCLENLDTVAVCAATHNIASTRHLVSEMARLGIPKDHPKVTASQLLGMFDRVTVPLAEAGYNTLKYVPYGNVRDAFPYLLRRADENKSVAEQLRSELAAVRAELARRVGTRSSL